MDPFQRGAPSERYCPFRLHLPGKPPSHIASQPSENGHEEVVPTSIDHQIDQAIANNSEIKLTALITLKEKDLTPQQLLRIGQYNPLTFVPLIAKSYPAMMPELLLHVPQEELRSSASCIRECIRHGSRVDIVQENQLTLFSLLCREPSLHGIVRDIIKGDLVQAGSIASLKRSSKENSPHRKRQRIIGKYDSLLEEGAIPEDPAAGEKKEKKQQVENREVTTPLSCSTGDAPQYLVDGLCEAIRAGNDRALAYFLPYRAILTGNPSNGKSTIVDIAIQSKNILCLKALLEANVDFLPRAVWQVLDDSIKDGHHELLDTAIGYLENRPTYAISVVNFQEGFDGTLLHHLAAQKPCNEGLIQKIIDLGARAATRNREGQTFLDVLAANESAEGTILGLFEMNEGLHSTQNMSGRSIFHTLACGKKPHMLPLLRKLLQKDAPPTSQDCRGDTIFHLLVQASKTNPDARQLLIELIEKHKDSVSLQNKWQKTIAHLLLDTVAPDVALVGHLIELGADPTIQDDHGNTTFHLLACFREPAAHEILQKYIGKYKHSMNVQNKSKKTISHLLLDTASPEVALVGHLMDLGADPTIQDDHGNTIFHLLACCRDPAAHQILQKYIGKYKDSVNVQNNNSETISHLILYTEPPNIALVGHLIELGADPWIQDISRKNMLHWLAYVSKKEPAAVQLLKELIKKYKFTLGVESTYYDLEKRNTEEQTPLLTSAYNGQLRAVEALIRLGANIYAVDSQGNTILHYATFHETDHLLNLEPLKECDLEATNNDGDTPLLFAVKRGRMGCVGFFIQRRANFHVKNHAGETFVHMVAEANQLDLLKYALSEDANLWSEDQYGDTPFLWAATAEADNVVQFFCKEIQQNPQQFLDSWMRAVEKAKGKRDPTEEVRYLLRALRNVLRLASMEEITDVPMETFATALEALQEIANDKQKKTIQALITFSMEAITEGPEELMEVLRSCRDIHDVVREAVESFSVEGLQGSPLQKEVYNLIRELFLQYRCFPESVQNEADLDGYLRNVISRGTCAGQAIGCKIRGGKGKTLEDIHDAIALQILDDLQGTPMHEKARNKVEAIYNRYKPNYDTDPSIMHVGDLQQLKRQLLNNPHSLLLVGVDPKKEDEVGHLVMIFSKQGNFYLLDTQDPNPDVIFRGGRFEAILRRIYKNCSTPSSVDRWGEIRYALLDDKRRR